MKRNKIILEVVKEDSGYSAMATIDDNFIATEAETFANLKANSLEAVNLAFEKKGVVYSSNEISFEYDL